MNKFVLHIVGTVFLVVGIILLAVGGVDGVRHRRVVADSYLVTATIVSTSRGEEGGDVYVEYLARRTVGAEAPDGDVVGLQHSTNVFINGRPARVLAATHQNMRFTSEPLDNKDIKNLGTTVKVIVHPDDPDKYVFDFAAERELDLFSGG